MSSKREITREITRDPGTDRATRTGDGLRADVGENDARVARCLEGPRIERHHAQRIYPTIPSAS